MSRGEVLNKLYELRKEVELFLIHKKSDLSHYFQDKKWVNRLKYLSDIFSYINELNLKPQVPDTKTIINAWNKIESFRKKLKLWLSMITEGTMKCFNRTQIILWKQRISIHRIQFQILLQLT